MESDFVGTMAFRRAYRYDRKQVESPGQICLTPHSILQKRRPLLGLNLNLVTFSQGFDFQSVLTFSCSLKPPQCQFLGLSCRPHTSPFQNIALPYSSFHIEKDLCRIQRTPCSPSFYTQSKNPLLVLSQSHCTKGSKSLHTLHHIPSPFHHLCPITSGPMH